MLTVKKAPEAEELGWRKAKATEAGGAVIATVNANDNGGAGRFSRPMRQLMLKGLKLPLAPTAGPRLADYAGRYDAQPFGSEWIIAPWGTGLVSLALPTDDPAAAMAVLKHVEGDTFTAVREDGGLGAEFKFQRDAAGRINGLAIWNQLYKKLQN